MKEEKLDQCLSKRAHEIEEEIMDNIYLVNLTERNPELCKKAREQLYNLEEEKTDKLYTMEQKVLELSEEEQKKLEDILKRSLISINGMSQVYYLLASTMNNSVFLNSPYYMEDLKIILNMSDVYQAYMILLAAAAEKSIQSSWHRQIIQLLATAKDGEESEEIERFFMAHGYFSDMKMEDYLSLAMELDTLIDENDVSFENVKQKVIPYMMYNGKKK